MTIIIRTARPGQVVGPKGQDVEQLTADLQALTGRKVFVIKIVEIQNPEIDATLLGEAIAEQLKKRTNFRRLIKQRCESAMQSGALGIRILISGRLGGAEMSVDSTPAWARSRCRPSRRTWTTPTSPVTPPTAPSG